MSKPSADPPRRSELASQIHRCTRCPLYRHATQGVPGTGPAPAPIMLVGEQPGDEEDRQGLPFVGPAGAVLDRALESAGLRRQDVYVTNAVKHFKWEPRGKRRMHKTPAQAEVAACHDWLGQEIELVAPRVVVALGTTALHALLGRREAIARARVAPLHHASGAYVVATYHPAAVLRAKDAAAHMFDSLCADLGTAKRLAEVSPDISSV